MGVLSALRRGAAAPAAPAELTARLDDADRLLRPAERAFAAQAENQWSAPRFAQTPYAEVLAQAPDEQLRAAALWAHRRVCATRFPWEAWACQYLLNALARKKLAWTVDEVRWALDVGAARRADEYALPVWLRLPLGAAERLPAEQVEPVRERLEELRSVVRRATATTQGADRQRLLRRIDTLLGDPGVPELPSGLLHDDDLLAPALRAELGGRLVAPGVAALLAHAASATSPNPTGAWRKEGRRLLQAAAGGSALVHDVLQRALAHRETLRRFRQWGEDVEAHVWLHESTALVVRGLVLVAGALDEPWVTPVLGDLAVHAGGGSGGSASTPRDLVVANAAVAALAQRPDAVPYLARAQARLKHRGVLKGVAKGLEVAAAKAGLTRSELLEAAVPAHGLDAEGQRREQLGEHTAVVAVTAPGAVTLTFATPTGRALAGVPAAVKEQQADRLARLRADVQEIKKTLATERLRVEALLAEDRSWAFDDWARLYRDHPLLGRLVRGLLWQVGDGTAWTTGRLLDDGRLTGVDGRPVPAGGLVRLWHPAQAPVEEVRAWRALLLDAGLRQPFKQAFREIYLLTPAELATVDHSNRFAAHILRAPQAQALMRARGWGGTSLGYYDGGYEGIVTREFGGSWRAEFFFDLVENDLDGYGTPSLASSDSVRFRRREGRNWALRPLAEVPPLVFTEAMRDVDLFVGVTSIAADPTWITRGARDHAAYWERASFGELTESAKTRREALERLVPRLQIADRCTLSDRFLEVRGSLREYRIHLGSGNVLMKPNDSYLCIVPARGDKGPRVYLPFEEDGGMLSVILSKAFLLARDSAITDRSILSQISGR